MTETCTQCGRFLEVPCQYLGRFCKYKISVVPKDSGESAPGVGDGSYPKKCSSLPIERQLRTSKTSNEAKQKTEGEK